jgi:hypothetical protein
VWRSLVAAETGGSRRRRIGWAYALKQTDGKLHQGAVEIRTSRIKSDDIRIG